MKGVIACGSGFNSKNSKTMYDMKGALYKMLPGSTLTGMAGMEVTDRYIYINISQSVGYGLFREGSLAYERTGF